MASASVRWFARLNGWRRLGVAFVIGAGLIFAFAPFSITPVLWLVLPLQFLLLENCKSAREAALVGWAFMTGHFVTSFYWLTTAFYVDADQFGAIAMPAVLGLAAFVGLFGAGMGLATHTIPRSSEDDMPDDRVAVSALRICLFAAAWTIAEWVRSWILTGFPWNPLGAVWANTSWPGLAVMQAATIIGTYGLSLITVLAASAPAVLIYTPRFRRAWVTAAIPTLCLLVIGGAGALRVAGAQTTFVPDVKLRLVQANIPQADRARPTLWESQLQDYVDLSLKDRPADITHVIWGEAAVPPTMFLNLDERHRRIAAQAAPAKGLLITGADRGLNDGKTWTAIYNSLYALTPDANIAAFYDKVHLVPFGEYMPLRWLIPYDKMTGGMGDFAAGSLLQTMNLPGLPPTTPLICYEVIFSGRVTPRHQARPRWLLNLTNDSWFGMSTGPYQHYAMARLRAVEEALPLVRTANSGISAVIDGYGRTVAELGLGERGVLDAPLPSAAEANTPFGLFGNSIPMSLATLLAAAALRLSQLKRRKETLNGRHS